MKRVSIIIPFYNQQDTLNDCINSALEQNSIETRIILVNNNSSDDSLNIAESFLSKYKNVALFHAATQGSSYARNRGLQECDSEWVQFLDADDILLPDKIKSQLIHANVDVDILCSSFTVVDGAKKTEKKLSADVWLGLIEGNIGVTSSMLFRKSAIMNVGSWSHEYPNNQEYELIFRMLQNGSKVILLNENQTIKNNHSQNSITSKTIQVYPKIAIALREKIEAYLSEQSNLKSSYKNALYRFYYDKICWLYTHSPKEAQHLYNKHFKRAANRNVIPFPKNLIERVFGFSFPRRIQALLRPK